MSAERAKEVLEVLEQHTAPIPDECKTPADFANLLLNKGGVHFASLEDAFRKAMARAYAQGVQTSLFGPEAVSCDYPLCDCAVSFSKGYKPSLATECPRNGTA